MVNKRVRNAVLGCNLKKDRMNSVQFQSKPFNITVIQAYAPTSGAEEAEVERFYEDLQPLRTNTQKRCPFHYRGLECKSRKSRNTWNNRKFGLGIWMEVIAVLIFHLSGVIEQVFPILQLYRIDSV